MKKDIKMDIYSKIMQELSRKPKGFITKGTEYIL